VGVALVLRDRQLKLGGAQLASEPDGNAVAATAGVFVYHATVDGCDSDRAVFFSVVYGDAVVVKITLVGAAIRAFECYEVVGNELDGVLRPRGGRIKSVHNGLSPIRVGWMDLEGPRRANAVAFSLSGRQQAINICRTANYASHSP
jgi:hypothetical protein